MSIYFVLLVLTIAVVSSTYIYSADAAEKTGNNCSKSIAPCAILMAETSSVQKKPS